MSRTEYDEWLDAHSWHPSRDSALTIQTDLTPAEWLGPRLDAGTFDVNMMVPRGFEAYARIFFPFVQQSSDVDGHFVGHYATWSQMARRNGRVAHALMERETISSSASGEAETDNIAASFGPDQFQELWRILAPHTSSAVGWFLLWDGFGSLNRRVFDDNELKIRHPMRHYFLLNGPLGAFDQFPDNPNYWWPEDRAWCVCTDTDFSWAYLAGSAACIDEVLAVPLLDAFRTSLDNPAHSGMDLINDAHEEIHRHW
jgi:hypothetical protein